ncbi:Rrf2 family transcriptional regulator [Variovorax guangxiensis]|uniref:Rrf2 family transcriptional regulator n=1 Tax=Variovorax guangxiensis TaxID=1775474 RepID=UPI002854F5F8|nr:Rrf2 family transcriptional regulator [Variovorax guangxiensis]MDR6858572.1 Rrf2 family nitric oxide-sensitive transcriptional repressor [Variovorax guangxiensis]
MRLTDYTDYTLRVLMYCAAHRERLVTITELAECHKVSKNHLMKIVNDLARQGVIETTRGRGGGLRLLKQPSDIRVGDVVRGAETDFRLVECFDGRTNTCTLTPTCRLKKVLGAALQAYFNELDGTTLADIAGPAPKTGKPGAAAQLPRRGVIAPVAAPVRSRLMMKAPR